MIKFKMNVLIKENAQWLDNFREIFDKALVESCMA